MRRFVSKLAYKLNDFIAYKNALGIKYDTSRVYLLELDQYNLEHGNYALLTKELAEGWALWHAENRSPRTGAGFHPSGNLVVICAVSEKVMPMSWMTDFPFNIIMRRYIS